ncbi:MAG: 30S ribosomal protein S6 [Sedimentisphaerales bacterium]|nr:30S ribosomal protein S6 [Sedimentisphaerales bacterium]
METVAKRLYEALFLVDSAEAATDAEGVSAHIEKIFERNSAEVVSIRKWDERPLAYEIMGKSRGTYFLVYFNSPSGRITSIERDIQLSERIMRVLILRADHVTEEDMKKDTPATMLDKKAQELQDSKKAPDIDYTAEAENEDLDVD